MQLHISVTFFIVIIQTCHTYHLFSSESFTSVFIMPLALNHWLPVCFHIMKASKLSIDLFIKEFHISDWHLSDLPLIGRCWLPLDFLAVLGVEESSSSLIFFGFILNSFQQSIAKTSWFLICLGNFFACQLSDLYWRSSIYFPRTILQFPSQCSHKSDCYSDGFSNCHNQIS